MGVLVAVDRKSLSPSLVKRPEEEDRAIRQWPLGVVLILLCAVPMWADTLAGLEAFKAKDYAKAFSEWKVSAEAGFADAQFDLGVLYAHGLGVPQDLDRAERWYRRSAEQGNR